MKRTNNLYQNENSMTETQKKYMYEIYINHNGNSLQNIEYLAKSFRLTKEKFLQIISSHATKNISGVDYSTTFDTLLLLESDAEIINYLNNIHADLKYLRSNILSYFIYFRPDIYFLDPEKRESLRKKLEIYRLYLKRVDNPPMDLQNKNTLEYSTNIIQQFIESNFSLKRFCFQYRILPEEMKRHSLVVKQNNPELYQLFQNIISLKKENMQAELEYEIRSLSFLIKNNQLDSIDVFQNTTYSILELIKYAGNILNKDENIMFKQFIHNFEKLKVLSPKGIEDFFEGKLIIMFEDEELEITYEMKNDLLNYLNENNIPITLVTIHDALKRKLHEKVYSKKI